MNAPAPAPRWRSMVFAAIRVVALLAALGAAPVRAMTIETVESPGGIEAWLVHETAVPVISINFVFKGGTAQDPADKPGVAYMVSSLLDEGAGDLDSKAFHQQLEDRAIEFSFNASRDYFGGSMRMLTEHRDKAFDLLRLMITSARFDSSAVERIRGQIMSILNRETTSPNELASRAWWSAAFPDHPYGRPTKGTLESVPRITVDDLKTYVRRVFARDGLKITVVGDIDAATAGRLLDHVFGSLPAKGDLTPVPDLAPQGLGRQIVVDVDVPQAVMVLGGVGVPRHDPEFIAAYIDNHILGGGAFSSRLYEQVREKRGLAYSVNESLYWLEHTALTIGGTATRADRAGDALAIIEKEVARFRAGGPTADELAKAKSFLRSSYALNLDTSTKIAAQLTQIQIDHLGIDYIDKRDGMIDAVTLDDAKRAAKRLLDGGLLVAVAGRPKGLTSKGPGG